MKAILVIDMPSTCCECKLFWNDVDCGCMALGRVLGEFGCSVGKPVDCPLKPLPKKKSISLKEAIGIKCSCYSDGWNDCLDEILGEKE